MGKKKKILLYPKKYALKHFEFLDKLDGSDDNVISSTKVAPVLRTLGLVDNRDRTVSVTAEFFGSGSAVDNLMLFVTMTGGVSLKVAMTSSEKPVRQAASSRGFKYQTSLPALKRAAISGPAGPYIFPAGTAKVKGVLSGSSGLSTVVLEESVTIFSNPLGLKSSALSGALSNTGALTLNTSVSGGLSGTNPQHGSGSGVSTAMGTSVANYDCRAKGVSGGQGHGFRLTVVGSVTGSLAAKVLTSSVPNGHNFSTINILTSASVRGLAPQDLTVTLTPVDVNGTGSAVDAVSHTFPVPFNN